MNYLLPHHGCTQLHRSRFQFLDSSSTKIICCEDLGRSSLCLKKIKKIPSKPSTSPHSHAAASPPAPFLIVLNRAPSFRRLYHHLPPKQQLFLPLESHCGCWHLAADNKESVRRCLCRAMNLLRSSFTEHHHLPPWRVLKRFMKSLRFPHGKPVESPSSTSSATPLAHGVHVFQCPDSVGIVAKLSECIASNGGNILGADVFVPEKKLVFYSRSEFIFDPYRWPRKQVDEDFLELSKLFHAMRSVVRVPSVDPKYKIAILASKQEHCLIDLLHEWQDGRLPVDIACVISNHDRSPNTHVIRFLERHSIPYHCLSTTPGNKREDEILDLVQDTDFLVLARYMQILSGDFLRAYGKDIINIHHGLLPSFKGGYPSKQAFEAGVKLIGATSHFVTQELDEGPIIEQMVERVSHRDNLQSFVRKSENLEKQCLAKAIKSYCELRVLPYEVNKTVVF